MITSYPKIFHLGHRTIKDIFDGEIFLEEKIDGSLLGWLKKDGQLYVRSKGKIQHLEAPDKLFKEGIDYLVSIQDNIPEGIMFYGEYLRTPSHNTLKYERIPTNHIVLFSAIKEDHTPISDRQELSDYANLLSIDVVPCLFQGKINNHEQIHELLDTESYLLGPKIEGIVVKNYNKSYLIADRFMPFMAGKYVSEGFKEVHRNWKTKHTNKGKWDLFKEKYRTEARWNKAVQHLQERNELENSPRDIGKLMKEVQADITEECKEEICEFLYKEFGSALLRESVWGLPEWYKAKLLKESFE